MRLLGVYVHEVARSAHKAALVVYASQVEACERGNQLREQLRERSAPLRQTIAVVARFADSAAGARQRSGNSRVAAEYRAYARQLRAIRLQDPADIDCGATVSRP